MISIVLAWGYMLVTGVVEAFGENPEGSTGSAQLVADQATPQEILAVSVATDGAIFLSMDVPLDSVERGATYDSSVVLDGLRFALVTTDDGVGAALVGTEMAIGHVSIPSMVEIGGEPYPVLRIVSGALEGRSITSVSVPASVIALDEGAFSPAPYLESIIVDAANEVYSSYDGVIYDAAMKSLLLIPEGKQGPVRIPKTTEVVPLSAFSHCALVESIEVEAGGAAFSSWNGCLYDSAGETLLRVPAGLGNDVEIAVGCSRVAAGAFEGCSLLRSLSGATKDLVVVGDPMTILVKETENVLDELTADSQEKAEESAEVIALRTAVLAKERMPLVSASAACALGRIDGIAEQMLAEMESSGEASDGMEVGEPDGASEVMLGESQQDSFSLSFVLDREPSRLRAAVGWLDGVEPPEVLSPESGTVFINNPTRKGYRFVGWMDEAGLIEKVDASKSVIHAERLVSDTRFVARWASLVSVDVPQQVRFEYVDVAMDGASSKEGSIVAEGGDGNRLSTSFLNRSTEFDLAIVGLESQSVEAGRQMIRATIESGRTDEEARRLKLISMYPDVLDGVANTQGICAVDFALDDLVGEDNFTQQGNAFLIPASTDGSAVAGLRVRYRLNLSDSAGGENFATLEAGIGLDKEASLARLSYTFASADLDRADTFAIGWEAGGGTFANGSSLVVDQCVNGQSPVPPTSPCREGYEFGGWALTESDAQQGNSISVLPQVEGNAVFYAVWHPREYSVKWYLNDGTDASSATPCKYGASIERPSSDPQRAWFAFQGWSMAADSRAIVADFGVMGAGDKAFYAVWKHEVLWRYNDGTDEGITNEFWPEEKILPPAAFNRSRKGYRFEGWTFLRDDVGRLMKDSDLPKAKDMTTPYVNACWSWGVAWFLNNDDNERIDLYHPQNKVVVPPNPGTKKGYTFVGWGPYSATPWQGAVTDIGTSPPVLGDPPAVRDYINGIWKLNTYTITWVDTQNWESPTSQTTTVGYGARTIAPVSLSRQGYTLKGWATTKGGGVTNLPVSTTESATYYTVWEPNTYTVTWKNFDREKEKDIVEHLDYGTKLVAPGNPISWVRDFLGWASTEGGAVISDLGTVTGDMTFYSMWSANPKTYTVHFFNNYHDEDFTHYDVDYVEAGDLIFAKPNVGPSHTGSRFVGWSETRHGDSLPYSTNVNGDYYIASAKRDDGGSHIYLFAQWRAA